MPDLVAVAGGKHFIGGVLSYGTIDWVEADFLTQTWGEVEEWETRGDLGDTAEEINTALISRGRNVKQKGTFDAGAMENAFAWTPGAVGQAALIAASKTRLDYAFRNFYSDAPLAKTLVVTVTIASPGVFTWTSHGFQNGTQIRLTTTGALPTGLAPATTYFAVGVTANTFSLALTKGGAAIVTSGTQSGIHTATTTPTPTTEYFTAKVMGAPVGGGGANDIMMLNCTLAVNSNIVLVPALG